LPQLIASTRQWASDRVVWTIGGVISPSPLVSRSVDEKTTEAPSGSRWKPHSAAGPAAIVREVPVAVSRTTISWVLPTRLA
jgi:hypothetical protein